MPPMVSPDFGLKIIRVPAYILSSAEQELSLFAKYDVERAVFGPSEKKGASNEVCCRPTKVAVTFELVQGPPTGLVISPFGKPAIQHIFYFFKYMS